MMVHPAGDDLPTLNAIAIQQLVVDVPRQAAHAAAAPAPGPQRARRRRARLRERRRAAPAHPARRAHPRHLHRRRATSPTSCPRHAAAQWYVRSATVAGLEPLKARVLACLEAGAEAAGCTMDVRLARPALRRHGRQRPAARALRRATPTALGRPFAEPAAAARRRQHRHGQRQPRRAVDPPDDRGVAARASRSTPRSSPSTPEGPAGDRAVLDGAKALARTIADLWLDPTLP